MVIASARARYDCEKIEKIVDQVFPCTAEAEFIKSVHARDAWKLLPWRNREESGKRVELISEAEALIRRCFLLKSQYYADCAARLKQNLQTEGYDAQWNIRLPVVETPAPSIEEESLPNWDDFLVDKNSFPVLDDATFSLYLEPSLIGPSDDRSLDSDLIDSSMEFESCGSLVAEGLAMEVDFSSALCPSTPSSPASAIFQNDYFGLAMDCDQDGLPLDILE
ncbi:hypothetical protein PMAYCL1PPCAC_31809 [Pristionchus mayeri]|uniref:Uncharacterized protein n=1 Tax=Pristionchus mayeri TaxID=1317129 RepID=A0AAN5DH13_9BILA|nr:hypothetical protein PMAYCL1PPCAC_31809 [Pristionchus mayeri]